MTRPFRFLAWTAAVAAYLLIVLGAVVRITGSGLGCGDEWPVCHGRLIPPLSDTATFIEWNHRLVAAIVSILVVALAGMTWWERRGRGRGQGTGDGGRVLPGRAGYLAAGLLIVQVLLGAVTVKLQLPPWTVILHLGTAMLLLATLLAAALGRPSPGARLTPGVSPGIPGLGSGAAALGFVTVLFGALTANLGAATACTGFPLCNGQLIPAGNYLQHIQWTHRLLAYGLFAYLVVWAFRTRQRGPIVVLGLAVLQIVVAAVMVLRGVPGWLQVLHAAVGTAVWAGLAIVALSIEKGLPAPAVPEPRAL
jgi:heme A synthase